MSHLFPSPCLGLSRCSSRPEGGDPVRAEPPPRPRAHREAAAHRHHHHHHRALHDLSNGGRDHAPHPRHGHRGQQITEQEQEGRQPEQDGEDGERVSALCASFIQTGLVLYEGLRSDSASRTVISVTLTGSFFFF